MNIFEMLMRRITISVMSVIKKHFKSIILMNISKTLMSWVHTSVMSVIIKNRECVNLKNTW